MTGPESTPALPRTGRARRGSPPLARHRGPPRLSRLRQTVFPSFDGGGYWPHAWVGAIAMYGLLVVRLGEIWHPLRAVRPVLVTGFVLVLCYYAKSSWRVIRAATSERQVRLTAYYGAWATVTVPFALWKAAAVELLPVFVWALLLLLSILLCAPSRKNLNRILTGYIAALAIYGLAVLAFGATQAGRLSGTAMYDPNDLAALLAAAFPLAVGLVMRRGVARRLLGLGAAILFVAIIAETASRGGVIALVAGTLVFVAGFSFVRTVGLSVLMVLGGILLWSYSPAVFRERTESIGSLQSDYAVTSETGRLQIWKRGIGYALHRPITGVGMNNFAVAEGQTFYQTGFVGHWYTAHDAYLQVAAELGVIGLSLFLTLLWTSGRQARRLWRMGWAARAPASPLHRPELLASLAAFATGALFLSHAYSLVFFGTIGFVAFASRVQRAELATMMSIVPPTRPATGRRRIAQRQSMQSQRRPAFRPRRGG